MTLIIATSTKYIKCARNSRMPAYINGAEHYHMVRVRVVLNRQQISGFEIAVLKALISEILSAVAPGRSIGTGSR